MSLMCTVVGPKQKEQRNTADEFFEKYATVTFSSIIVNHTAHPKSPTCPATRALYASGFHPPLAGHFILSRSSRPRRCSSSAGDSASTPSPPSLLLEALRAPPLSRLSVINRSSLSRPGTHPRRLMPASALYLTAESVSRMSSHRGSRAESDKWRAKRGKVGLGVDVDAAVAVCGGPGRRAGEPVPCNGDICTLSGRRRRGTGGGDG